MDDLALTRACAEAMGFQEIKAWEEDGTVTIWTDERWTEIYDPLHDDAQAMALVKKFELHIFPGTIAREKAWHAERLDLKVAPMIDRCRAYGPDLNRAIVECVAKLQSTKSVRKEMAG